MNKLCVVKKVARNDRWSRQRLNIAPTYRNRRRDERMVMILKHGLNYLRSYVFQLFWYFVIWFFIQSSRYTNWAFFIDYVNKFVKNGQIYGRTILGYCTMIMLQLTLHCLYVHFFKNSTVVISQSINSADIDLSGLFFFQGWKHCKVVKTLQKFRRINDLKTLFR